jgi:hypothetical protein
MMTDNSNRSDPAKKYCTLSISIEEIEKQLSIIFDSQICSECEHDHSFKNSFENVKTNIDDFLKYFTHDVSGMNLCVIGRI